MNKQTEPLSDQWDTPTRLLHWVSAIWVLALMGLGLAMVNFVKASGLKFELYQLHKSYGFLFGFVLIARLVWKFFVQRHRTSNTGILRQVGIINQNLMLFLLFALIVSGYLATCFSVIPIPIHIFGWNVPSLLSPHMLMEQRAISAHHVIAFILLALVLIHIGAALFHHFILKDKTLIGMLRKGNG